MGDLQHSMSYGSLHPHDRSGHSDQDRPCPCENKKGGCKGSSQEIAAIHGYSSSLLGHHAKYRGNVTAC